MYFCFHQYTTHRRINKKWIRSISDLPKHPTNLLLSFITHPQWQRVTTQPLQVEKTGFQRCQHSGTADLWERRNKSSVMKAGKSVLSNPQPSSWERSVQIPSMPFSRSITRRALRIYAPATTRKSSTSYRQSKPIYGTDIFSEKPPSILFREMGGNYRPNRLLTSIGK